VFRFLHTIPEHSYDFVFADPPFLLQNLSEIPRLVIEKKILRQAGVLVMEHPMEYDFSSLPFFQQRRVYGAVNFSFFRLCE
jgi:16S rRNA G966 N2-methylase RsmD